MNRIVFSGTFVAGLLVVAWAGVGFVGSSALALLMTGVIGAAYLLGAYELRQFRADTAALSGALSDMPEPLPDAQAWLSSLPVSLRNPVRLRLDGVRAALPGPALTPYLVGLLVMLGMLGTFLGMVTTFKGVVFALEGSADLQAIRSALAAPIRGLGLSFGTSVAGVAASAALGLLSALCRRERAEAARLLDSRLATVLRPFSVAHQRQETFRAVQAQAQALPGLVDQLASLMDKLERQNHLLAERLTQQQTHFHRDVTTAYTELAHTVGRSLRDSLQASAAAASAGLQPVVEAAMQRVEQASASAHQRQMEAVQAQLGGLVAEFGATARQVSDGWTTALDQHSRTSRELTTGVGGALDGFARTFEQRSAALLGQVQASAAEALARQTEHEAQRQQVWTQSLQQVAAALQQQWQQAGVQWVAQQQAVCQALEQAAADVARSSAEQARQGMADMTRLLAQAEELVRTRTESEARWMAHHEAQLCEISGVWRTELAALRDEEAVRAEAAVQRLDALQAALAQHLATLGSALEAPMSRLMQTAAEVPQAAAGVMAQLREELGRLTERENQALEDRAGLMARLGGLLQALQHTAGDQRAAIDTLVSSAQSMLERTTAQFGEALAAQAGRAGDAAAQVGASAVELASLGEAFQQGVALFSAGNEKLLESLQRIDASLTQSMARSDEQLAYYVAQAREVIDLSLSAQQGVLEDLRRLQAPGAAPAREA